MSKRYDLLLRLLLVGETGVGKTCLLCKYINQDFISAHISTIGIDFKMKTLQIDDRIVKVQIWDTAGQERFESITKQFYRRAQGVLLVYDMSSRSSFEAIPKWLAYVEQFCKEDVSVMLLGNKCDREDRRQVTTKEASQFAKDHGIMFSETSAKNSNNLEKAFLDMCTNIIESQEQQAAESRSSISLDEDSSHFDSHSDSSQLLSDGGRKRCC
ncbi:RAB15 [Mytilus coruscus]|uniref:RAB15 n=1 Tax=Mytilus coruscus TaxID=42192 RepID=A0A6J8CDG8_MYTCO|nr:RAB15 [Mytilus coruscus]